jgi:omega-hydroxy-beta-dihydromenaquinone-9 sulfotransferase
MNEALRIPHSLTGIAPGPWFQLLRQAGGIEPKRLADITKISLRGLQGMPLALRETRLTRARIAEHRMDPRPLFIIGHFRSGTTLLHDLLAHDPAFVYPTTFQVFFPRLFVTGKELLSPAFERSLPPHRHGDRVAVTVDGPHEDEFALGQMSPLGFYHALYFPKRGRELFDRSVFLDDESDRALWNSLYTRFLSKVSLEGGGRPLLVKNPAHSGRIPLLLTLFPQARFIHIHRNPFAVYLSTLHFFRRFVDRYAFQRISDTELDQLVLYFYQRLMTRLFDDLPRIPNGQLAHVCYEQLVRDPATTVERAYRTLRLDLPEPLRDATGEAARLQKTFETNTHLLDPSSRQALREHCGFALDRLGYDPEAPHDSAPALS